MSRLVAQFAKDFFYEPRGRRGRRGGEKERKKGKSLESRTSYVLGSPIGYHGSRPRTWMHASRPATKSCNKEYIYISTVEATKEGRKERRKGEERGERLRFLERREATMISKRVKGEVSWMDSGGRFEFGGHSRFLELSSARYPLEEEGRGEAARCLVLSSAVDHRYHGYHHGI